MKFTRRQRRQRFAEACAAQWREFLRRRRPHFSSQAGAIVSYLGRSYVVAATGAHWRLRAA